jgi:hypothetical protein
MGLAFHEVTGSSLVKIDANGKTNGIVPIAFHVVV